MPEIDTRPKSLKPYLFHGVYLEWENSSEGEAKGNCPFCGREGKFTVNIKTGLWRCFVCAEGSDKGGGNAYTFIRKLWELSNEATTEYEVLAEDRGFLDPDSLLMWGVSKSVITDEWLIPGYGANGNLNQLYKYINYQGKMRVIMTPTLGHQMFRPNPAIYDDKKSDVYLCEGPWDAVALWEVLAHTKLTDDGFASTSNEDMSLLSSGNVVGIPGCETFFEQWAAAFADKNVILLFDNDHARKHPKTGKPIAPAGYNGMKRVTEILTSSATPPESIRFLNWGGEGKSFDPSLPSGYDLRDHFKTAGNALGSRINAWGEIWGKIADVPGEWLKTSSKGVKSDSNAKGLGTSECSDYVTLINSCRAAMKWTEGLDLGMSVSLACVVSTMQTGDQLWIKLIGPPSSGKSTLAEALSNNKTYIIAKSHLKGFFSGYNNGEAGGEDYSLFEQAKGKTLIIKDGDTLLKAPNRDEILAQARDIYDCVSRTSFKNKASKDYEGYRMGFILCGTSAMRLIDASELGERFLDCVIMEGIDDDLEDDILWRVAHKADRNVRTEASDEPEKRQDAESTEMMRLTAGYIDYLRMNAKRLFSEVEMDDEAKHRCTRLGKFVAFMRTRPSRTQDESQEREFAARLVIQHVRLALCLAVVMNKKRVDDEIMRRVTRIAMFTGRGLTLNILKELAKKGREGMALGAIALSIDKTNDRTASLLRFMKALGVVEFYTLKKNGVVYQTRYRPTEKIAALYEYVTSEEL